MASDESGWPDSTDAGGSSLNDRQMMPLVFSSTRTSVSACSSDMKAG